MSGLNTKIRLYLNREVEFGKDVILFDDGDGVAYIKEWNVAEAQPTQEQLDALDSQGDTVESNKQVDRTRKRAYGSWQDQLDEIYHNIDDWKARIQSIKDSNPKS